MDQGRDADQVGKVPPVESEREEIRLLHQRLERPALGELGRDERTRRPAAAGGDAFAVEQSNLFAAFRQKIRRSAAVDTGTDDGRVVDQKRPCFF